MAGVRAFAYTTDDGGCRYYRLILPSMALAEHGHSLEVREATLITVDNQGGWAVSEPPAEAYVFQRPAKEITVRAIAWLKDNGRRSFVEFDDALDIVPPFNEAQLRMRQLEQNPRNMLGAMHAASGIIVSTRELAERYRPHNPNVRVVENHLDTSLWKPRAVRSERPVVGWSGSATHLGDLLLLRGWLERPIQKHGAVFRVGGAEVYAQFFPGLDVERQPWVSLDEWPATIAALDIGLAPLADNAFNRCKSHLKVLEYAAAGIPCIASDLPNYRRFVRHGETGFIAKHNRDWSRFLDLLLADESLRTAMGAAARELAEDYDIRRHVGEWEEALFG